MRSLVRPHLKTPDALYQAHRGCIEGRAMPKDLIRVGLNMSSPNIHGEKTVSLTPAHANSLSCQINDSAGFSTMMSASRSV